MRIIAGNFYNRPVVAPKGLVTRPTSERTRATVYNVCQMFVEGADILDLYAGSGAIGLEGLSRGARSATFVEEDHYALKVIEKNMETFGCKEQSIVLRGDVFPMLKLLGKQTRSYDIIYADPPYEHCNYHDLIALIDELQLLRPGGRLFVEAAAKPAIQIPALRNLERPKERKAGRSVLYEFRFLNELG